MKCENCGKPYAKVIELNEEETFVLCAPCRTILETLNTEYNDIINDEPNISYNL